MCVDYARCVSWICRYERLLTSFDLVVLAVLVKISCQGNSKEVFELMNPFWNDLSKGTKGGTMTAFSVNLCFYKSVSLSFPLFLSHLFTLSSLSISLSRTHTHTVTNTHT